ncbi:MAG: Blue-light-activated protein [Syntrophus sp. PtaB.Bin001]|nr:MAG: Blue-light-activated protein [Syntrophus sp. PtaB.Bin001]
MTGRKTLIPVRWHRKKDGTVFPVEITASHFIWNSRPVHIAAIRDISSRLEAEEERKRLEERLHRAEKMEALGTMAGGVAHDLNNILGVLVGYSELLLLKMPEDSPFRGHIINILESGKRSAAIIQDLLALTRRGVTVSKVLNLNRIIYDCLKTPEFETLKSLYPGVTFRTDLNPDLLNIKGSPVHLGKMVMNLLTNAAEASFEQGKVMIGTENRYLDSPVSGYDELKEGEHIILTVSDQGKGIAPKDIGRIFEPFYTKKMMGRSGTGLGLAVVWGAVKDHGGYIDVKSAEGEGTTFTLYFPAVREAEDTEQQKPLFSEYEGRNESILVVDDVEEQRKLALNMLTTLGYQATAVSSGEEALEYLQTTKVDLLVLDMIMTPGMDGLETYRRILEFSPKQKAVIVSGYSETDKVREVRELGAGAYIQKPYLMDKFGLAVRKVLDRN